MVHAYILYYITFHNEVDNMDKRDLDRMASYIKEKRKAYGYTQEQMAEQLEMSYSYYTKIENGFQMPSFGKLIKIVSLLHLSLDKLIFGKDMTEQPFSPDTQELLQFIKQYDKKDIVLCRDLLNKIISYLD